MTNKLALVVAVVLGALSILGIKAYVERVKTAEQLRVAKVPVFVASREIDEGRTFSEDDMDTAEFPRDTLERALQNTWITDKQTIIGLRTKSKIKAGQILLSSHFERGRGKVADRLKFLPNQRAITVAISRTGGLSGMLRPQDLVDIIVSMTVTDTAGRTIKLTRTLFKTVQILATDANLDPSRPSGRYTTLTFALSPRDANKLLYVISEGAQIQCALTMPGAPESKGYTPVIANTLYDEIAPELRSRGMGRRR